MATSKKTCKAQNAKGKCIYYKAEHKLEKAAKAHKQKIEKRGGKASVSKKGNGYVIDYSFPAKKVTKKSK